MILLLDHLPYGRGEDRINFNPPSRDDLFATGKDPVDKAGTENGEVMI